MTRQRSSRDRARLLGRIAAANGFLRQVPCGWRFYAEAWLAGYDEYATFQR